MIITLSTLISLINKKTISDMIKLRPFECGFNPIANKRSPFSIHFFLIAVIFLIFDIEIIILIPIIISIKFSIIKIWFYSSTIITTILIVGLYNEWYQGILNWTN